MASEDNPDRPEGEQPSKWEPPSPTAKKRLQKCFEHAGKQMSQDNFDYATELFGQCVMGDPTNHVYVQSFLGNLRKKYHDNKKGASLAQLKERRTRTAVKKALAKSEWYDSDTQRRGGPEGESLGRAHADRHGHRVGGIDGRFRLAGFLRVRNGLPQERLDMNSKDPEVNRLCGIVLGKRRVFDQAIVCWHRVEQARPDDDEPKRAIASLAVEKTIIKSDDSDPMKISARGQPGSQQQSQEDLTPEERLRRKLAKDPKDLASYNELAQFLVNADRYREAEEALSRALKVSTGDHELREKLNDVQVRHLRHRYLQADKRAKESGSEEAKIELKKLYKALNQKSWTTPSIMPGNFPLT